VDEQTDSISFQADAIHIAGPKPDGTITVSFDTGEYEREKVAQLLTKMGGSFFFKITVENV